ncbi:hypothetical protein [Amycolatopsis sp. NPDC054798]
MCTTAADVHSRFAPREQGQSSGRQLIVPLSRGTAQTRRPGPLGNHRNAKKK